MKKIGILMLMAVMAAFFIACEKEPQIETKTMSEYVPKKGSPAYDCHNQGYVEMPYDGSGRSNHRGGDFEYYYQWRDNDQSTPLNQRQFFTNTGASIDVTPNVNEFDRNEYYTIMINPTLCHKNVRYNIDVKKVRYGQIVDNVTYDMNNVSGVNEIMLPPIEDPAVSSWKVYVKPVSQNEFYFYSNPFKRRSKARVTGLIAYSLFANESFTTIYFDWMESTRFPGTRYMLNITNLNTGEKQHVYTYNTSFPYINSDIDAPIQLHVEPLDDDRGRALGRITYYP